MLEGGPGAWPCVEQPPLEPSVPPAAGMGKQRGAAPGASIHCSPKVIAEMAAGQSVREVHEVQEGLGRS